ncbi:hypothetical protein [Caulobacter sp. 17J80-11]|uniref:hypothetical protein n=1 Tax=Caulobacter sp. 17J80-11 TaxID=2763502 RepID=UPI001653AC54|nr:hypothetical protein [Caulobacter sp. 17J80-11]MBC6983729.1 hypothetical protein [Caulobacter sp. 17J80-11]
MRTLIGLTVTVLAACSTPAPATAAADPSGVYSSVEYVEEAGDLLGMEIELHAGHEPTVIVTDCEGECFGGKVWPATIVGDQINFTVVQDDLVDSEGTLVRGERIRYAGWVKGSVLVLTSPDLPELKEKLKRIADPKPAQTAQLGCGADVC